MYINFFYYTTSYHKTIIIKNNFWYRKFLKNLLLKVHEFRNILIIKNKTVDNYVPRETYN